MSDIFKEHRVTVAEKRIENNEDNIKEAFVLLDLVNAEFQSDPMSTACFDKRIVDRVKACVAKRRQFFESDPAFMRMPRYVPNR